MDQNLRREILLSEIKVLEQALIDGGAEAPSFLESLDALSNGDLAEIKHRLDHLVRSMGGVKR